LSKGRDWRYRFLIEIRVKLKETFDILSDLSGKCPQINAHRAGSIAGITFHTAASLMKDPRNMKDHSI
jgi:hypothetical protein